MFDEYFKDWCKNNGVEQPENNSDKVNIEMTVEEYYYFLYDCFCEGKKAFNNF